MTEEKTTELWRAEWLSYKGMAEEAFERYVMKSNDLVRQMALAGIAVVWVFRETTTAGAVNLSAQLRWAAILFVVCLGFDLIHYLYGTLRTSGRLDAIKAQETAAIRKGTPWPEAPNGPPPDLPQFGVLCCFALKTCALAIGAGLLLHFLAIRL